MMDHHRQREKRYGTCSVTQGVLRELCTVGDNQVPFVFTPDMTAAGNKINYPCFRYTVLNLPKHSSLPKTRRCVLLINRLPPHATHPVETTKKIGNKLLICERHPPKPGYKSSNRPHPYLLQPEYVSKIILFYLTITSISLRAAGIAPSSASCWSGATPTEKHIVRGVRETVGPDTGTFRVKQ